MSTNGHGVPRFDDRAPPTRRQLKEYFPDLPLGYYIHALPEHGVVYVKNPKAACSTVLVWLSRLHTDQVDFSPKNAHTDHPLPRPRETGWPRVCRMLGGDAYRFSFVRNPLRRLESAYHDKIVKATRSSWRERVLSSLDLPKDTRQISFSQFVTALEHQDPIAEMDPHWRPQHINLMHPLVEYDHIGKLETFADDLERIRESAGLPDVPYEMRNVRSTGANDSVYDGRPDLVRRVEQLYADDFEIYGY